MPKLGTGKSLVTVNTSTQVSRDSEDDLLVTSIIPNVASKPTPVQFDTFIPWVCSQWSASTTVIVKRHHQALYIKYDAKKPSYRASRKGGKQKTISAEDTETINESSSIAGSDFGQYEKVIPIKAYYNTKGQLVEIAMIGPFKISRKVIHAISLCVPYHSKLSRLTIRRGGLTDELIYEIDKLLPYSNITEICFDDSFVREANYYILLEEISQLKYLSLNRCGINDIACKKIAINIDFGTSAASTLQILELGSNVLTDDGAKSLGLVLMKNRCLLHLNLSGNKITDEGFIAIMNSLMQFPLNSIEISQMKGRKLRYLRNKSAVYERCLLELKYGAHEDVESGAPSKKLIAAKHLHKKTLKKSMSEKSASHHAEIMAKGIVGEFKDPYCSENVVVKDGYKYSKGNMILCSLNMAYNALAFPSVCKLNEVLGYQFEQEKIPPETGLIRVTLDGNYIPSSCSELDEIDGYLKTVLASRLPTPRKTRALSTPRSHISTKGWA